MFIGFPGETEEEARETRAFSQAMLRLSRETYKNPYSSIGMGAFNLEVYSDVYNHPDRYGVRLTSAAAGFEVDDIFTIDFEVDEGLSRDEAARLVRDFNNSGIFYDACKKTGRVWWQSLWNNDTNEDQDFILYAFRVEKGEVEEPESGDGRTHRYLAASMGPCSLRLAPGVRTGWFKRDFLLLDDGPAHEGGVLSFYGRDQDLAVNLPPPVGAQILDLIEAGRVEGALGPDVRRAVDQLLRHGLLVAEGEGVAETLPSAELQRERSARLRFNPEVSILQLRPSQIELFNVTSQELLTVNSTVAWLASEVREAPLTFGALVQKAKAEARLLPETVEPAILALVDHKVLLAEPGA
jgi:hypothetical protein